MADGFDGGKVDAVFHALLEFRERVRLVAVVDHQYVVVNEYVQVVFIEAEKQCGPDHVPSYAVRVRRAFEQQLSGAQKHVQSFPEREQLVGVRVLLQVGFLASDIVHFYGVASCFRLILNRICHISFRFSQCCYSFRNVVIVTKLQGLSLSAKSKTDKFNPPTVSRVLAPARIFTNLFAYRILNTFPGLSHLHVAY